MNSLTLVHSLTLCSLYIKLLLGLGWVAFSVIKTPTIAFESLSLSPCLGKARQCIYAIMQPAQSLLHFHSSFNRGGTLILMFKAPYIIFKVKLLEIGNP